MIVRMWRILQIHIAGTQLGMLEGRGPIHDKKGTLKLFKEEMARGLASIISLGVLEVLALQKRIFPCENSCII